MKVSHTVFAIPWTATCPAPLSMEFSKQEYRSPLPFPSLGDLPNWGIEPRSPTLQADSFPADPQGKPLSEMEAPFSFSHQYTVSSVLAWEALDNSQAGVRSEMTECQGGKSDLMGQPLLFAEEGTQICSGEMQLTQGHTDG